MDRNVTTSRFSSIPWYKETRTITIGGAGTIGSWTAFLLMRSNDHNIEIVDDDKVESHNLAGQFFNVKDIDAFKAEAVKNHIVAFNPDVTHLIYPSIARVDESSEVNTICISGFDNMKARATMFDLWCKKEDREVFIDGRMAIETFEVFFVKKGEEEKYRKTLFDDSKLPDPICSLKSTSHTGAIIGSIIVGMLNNHLALVKDPDEFRRVPFHFTGDFPTFNFKIRKDEDNSVDTTIVKLETVSESGVVLSATSIP